MKTAIALTLLLVGLSTSHADAQEKEDTEPSSRAASDLDALAAELKKAVTAGELTEKDAIAKYQAAAGKRALDTKNTSERKAAELVWELLQLVEKGELTADQAIAKYKRVVFDTESRADKAGGGKTVNLKEAIELSKTLPATSTANDEEGPDSTFIFGWAANATHRFMDNSHLGKPRQIRGVSFRLDHRNHDAIGRTWKNVTVQMAHGDFSSIKYNRSTEFALVDEPVKVFDRQWSFPALKGYPPLKPAPWGGLQNSLTFLFDEPWEYNGKDAIYAEFRFSGGTADDGHEWKGELPYGFEYYLDSMPQIGGWRMAVEKASDGRIYTGAVRVAAVTSYTAGSQSVWTSAPKGMPFIRWEK